MSFEIGLPDYFVEICDKLRNFKVRNKELQSHPGINPLDEVIGLTKEYDEVLNDYIVSTYLQAEQKVCKLMQNIYNNIKTQTS